MRRILLTNEEIQQVLNSLSESANVTMDKIAALKKKGMSPLIGGIANRAALIIELHDNIEAGRMDDSRDS